LIAAVGFRNFDTHKVLVYSSTENMKLPFFLLLILTLGYACTEEIPLSSSEEIITEIKANYSLLPEEQISISDDNLVFAAYANPTERYAHGILGDKIEAGSLVISANGVLHELNLPVEYVFEDIRPRLYDVDGDGALEFITIRSHVNQGAGIMIYKILVDQLIEYAYVPEWMKKACTAIMPLVKETCAFHF